MEKYIALLRGINVSGQKKIKMSDLKILFEELSFTNVVTYIQSGNVLFSSDSSDKKIIREKIENKIQIRLGYQVQVIIKALSELKLALKNNSLLKKKKNDLNRIYFTFLSEKPSPSNIKILNEFDHSPEQFILNGDVAYLFLPNGAGKANLNNNFFEKKLNVFATTRNYKTVKTLLSLTENK